MEDAMRLNAFFKVVNLSMIVIVLVTGVSSGYAGQSQTSPPAPAIRNTGTNSGSALTADPGDEYFRAIYRDFYNSYKLGPEDQIALRVKGQPDYSIEQVTVSPVGKIYYPLLGDLDVAGLTVPKLIERLTID